MKEMIQNMTGIRKIALFLIVLISLFILVIFNKITGSEMLGTIEVVFGFFVGGNAVEYAVKPFDKKNIDADDDDVDRRLYPE